jgi:putative chitinase
MASENGWEPLHPNADQLEWVIVPGTNVHLQFLKGWPSIILRAFAADFNAYIEPLRDADSAGYTATNSVATSNHLNGTAMDLNWNSHPFRVLNAGFDAAKIATARELLKFYEDTVWWGNDWNTPKDAMHWNLSYNTYNNPRLGDFISRKIRADGFSTFRRGGTVTPPAPSSNAADVLARATGITLAKATDVLPLVSFALSKCNCTNPRRIAAALAQWVVESGHFVYTEEIADGPESEERWKYKGRTWIQLTWLENYEGFSRWCYSLGLVPTPDYFVVNPHELANQKWAALGPAYWWAVKYPRINEYADRGDIDNVSKWVNAPAWVDNPNKHANGEQARRDAYNKALALGDQLLTLTSPVPPQGDDELSAEAERMIREMYDEYKKEKRGPSRGFFAPDSNPVDSPLGFLWNVDGNVWNQEVTWGYLFGVRRAEELVNNVAQNGVAPQSWAGQLTDAQGHWLAEWGQQWCLGLISFRAAIQKAFKAAGAAPVTMSNPQVASSPVVNITSSDVQDIANRVSQQITIPVAPPPAVPAVAFSDGPAGLGDVVKTVVDAVEKLQLSDALSTQDYATLNASIKLLEMKNGTA